MEGRMCSEIGLCHFPQCSDGRTLDPAFASDRASLWCNWSGLEVLLEAELTAEPTVPITAGSNTYQVQPAITIPEEAVHELLSFEIKLVEARTTIAPTVGTSSPTSLEIDNAPLPCSESLRFGAALDIVFPGAEATWDLDEGVTQELTLEHVEISIELTFGELLVSTRGGGNCTWNSGPPRVVFNVP
jgi:hypothetical protein